VPVPVATFFLLRGGLIVLIEDGDANYREGDGRSGTRERVKSVWEEFWIGWARGKVEKEEGCEEREFDEVWK
jgi:hypothetical protein